MATTSKSRKRQKYLTLFKYNKYLKRGRQALFKYIAVDVLKYKSLHSAYSKGVKQNDMLERLGIKIEGDKVQYLGILLMLVLISCGGNLKTQDKEIYSADIIGFKFYNSVERDSVFEASGWVECNDSIYYSLEGAKHNISGKSLVSTYVGAERPYTLYYLKDDISPKLNNMRTSQFQAFWRRHLKDETWIQKKLH